MGRTCGSTAMTEQPGQDNCDRTPGTSQSAQVGLTGQPERDKENRMAKKLQQRQDTTGPTREDIRDTTARIGKNGQDGQKQ